MCYGLCGHHAAVDQTGLSEEPADPDASYGGHAAGGDHVGPCGGEWQTNFDLPITQSCCREGNNPPQISTGEYACECPMEVTCAGMADASGSGGCVEDIVVDGVVDVNDLLGVLSAYGGTDPAADIDGNGSVDVNDLLGVLSAFGSECSGGAAPEPAAPTCTQGTDCGGQVWNTCASSCPSICGTPGPMMCNSMVRSCLCCSLLPSRVLLLLLLLLVLYNMLCPLASLLLPPPSGWTSRLRRALLILTFASPRVRCSATKPTSAPWASASTRRAVHARTTQAVCHRVSRLVAPSCPSRRPHCLPAWSSTPCLTGLALSARTASTTTTAA